MELASRGRMDDMPSGCSSGGHTLEEQWLTAQTQAQVQWRRDSMPAYAPLHPGGRL